MKGALEKFLEYLRNVRNASPLTIYGYDTDLQQFLEFLSPPGSEPCSPAQVDHLVIREYLGHLHDRHLQKISIARKLSTLRSFFKFCAREGLVRDNPARLVSTPKLPKRLPSVLSAEEMNAFLDQLGTPGGGRRARCARGSKRAETNSLLLLPRDRAILELLYASGLRVSELTGLNLADINRKEQMLRVVGKGNKERIIPYGSKAEQALEKYWPIRSRLLSKAGPRGVEQAVFLNHSGGRLTPRSVARMMKKYLRLVNVNGTCIRTRCGTPSPAICSPTAPICGPFKNCWAIARFPPRSATHTPPSGN
jgi:integrase/recombinase XerC